MATKKLVSATLLYTALNFLQPILSFILQPFYLQYFTPDKYAIYSLMNNYATLINILCDLGISGTFFTFYYDYSHNHHLLKKFLGNMLSFGIYASIFTNILMYGIGGFIFSIVFKSNEINYQQYGTWATFIGTLSTVYNPFCTFLRQKQNLVQYAIIILISVVLGVLFQVYFISVLKWGVEGSLIGRALGMLVACIYAIVQNIAVIHWRLNWQMLKKPFKFSQYSLPNSIANWGSSFIDRFVFERVKDLTLLGMYSLLSLFAGIIEMAYFALRSAIQPNIYAALSMNEPQKSIEINKLTKFYTAIILFFISSIIVLVCNIDLIIPIKNYTKIKEYIFIYALSYLFSGLSFLGYLQYYYFKNSKIVLRYNLMCLFISLILNLTLIPIFGVWGAVYTFLIARFITFFTLIIFKPDIKNIILQKNIFIPALIACLTIICINELTQNQILSYTVAGIAQFVIVISVLLYNYLNEIKNFITQKCKPITIIN